MVLSLIHIWVVYGEETAPRYEYDYNAKGQVARVRDNLLNRTTQSEYDLANRPVRVKTAEAVSYTHLDVYKRQVQECYRQLRRGGAAFGSSISGFVYADLLLGFG